MEYKIHVDDSRTEDNCQYDMLLGGDLCTELGLLIDYNDNKVHWDNTDTPMVDRDVFRRNNVLFHELYENTFDSEPVKQATSRMTKILDNTYHKANLLEIVDKCQHLTLNERKQLYEVLRKHEPLFDGTLGK